MEFTKTLFISGFLAPLGAALFIYVFGAVLPRAGAKLLAVLAAFVSLTAALWCSSKVFAGGEVAAYNGMFGAFALNGISAVLYLLSGIVGFAAVLWRAANPAPADGGRTYCALLLTVIGALMGAFSSVNIFWMYAFHEFALIPTFIAICVWGGENKRRAAMEMAVYLTLGALLSLIGFIALGFSAGGSLKFNFYELVELAPKGNGGAMFVLSILVVGLGALVSLFPFHSWAPKTYNAAPTEFAMLHAGVLKKFGLYMFAQVVLPLYSQMDISACSKIVAVLALVNVIGIGLCTMAQSNFKTMVSYSSVSHMGLCFLGIFSMSFLGAGGAVMLMFGHGLSVAALFIFADILERRFGTSEMGSLGGVYKKMPVCAGLFAAAVLANIGLPGFANFWGEFSVFAALWQFSPIVCALAVSGIVISAVYGLRAVANIFMGGEGEAVRGREAKDVGVLERLPIVLLLAGLVVFGFAPKIMTNSLNSSFVEEVVEK